MAGELSKITVVELRTMKLLVGNFKKEVGVQRSLRYLLLIQIDDFQSKISEFFKSINYSLVTTFHSTYTIFHHP